MKHVPTHRNKARPTVDLALSKTHPVGQKKANEYGFYNISVNIHELTWGWYGRYSSGSPTDLTGVTGYSYRVLRGGNYYYGWYVRVSRRYNDDSMNQYSSGFRLRKLSE